MAEAMVEKESGRVESFSDAVFAFALTLLVLDLHAPNASEDLGKSLMALWPSYLAFALAFLAVIVMWLNHHGIFRRIRRVDGALLVANLILLFFVVLAPFVTAVLSANVTHGGARLAAAIASAYFLVVTLLFRLVWAVAARPGSHLVSAVPPQELRSRSTRNLVGVAAYGVALLSSLWTPWATIAVCYATVVFFLLLGIRRNTDHAAGP